MQEQQMYETRELVVVGNLRVDKILRPYSFLRNIHIPRTVLVIASEQCLSVPHDLKTFTEGDNGVHVYYTKKLPLSNNINLPIESIVLVYKIFDRDNLKAIKDSLPYIDVRYLVGKCFILVTSDKEFCSGDTEEIETFASSYHLPIHFFSKTQEAGSDGKPRLQIPSNLMAIYCPPVGSDVNSLIINGHLLPACGERCQQLDY
ncbi:uncharacterized protein LOC131952653 [Physella acuta]|uniref:uncharacterized protein LOC131952653 n=1 Tax=Physella acuta TaxID=109671 RepID=UPI0027DD2151|nr:uncharacterized protein LOC131952653 [Physella acuta]